MTTELTITEIDEGSIVNQLIYIGYSFNRNEGMSAESAKRIFPHGEKMEEQYQRDMGMR